MLNKSYAENVKHGLLQEWDDVAKCKKPIIAAVNGYAVSRSNVLSLFHHYNICPFVVKVKLEIRTKNKCFDPCYSLIRGANLLGN